MHQVVAAHIRCLAGGQRDRAGIVDGDINAAERLRRFGQGRLDRRILADIDHQRQGFAAGLFDLLGCAVDRAFKLGVRLSGFRRNDNIRPVARGPERNRQADAARGAGDEQCFVFQ